jgi:glycosyltransferase involved in cell wall biosynthesis
MRPGVDHLAPGGADAAPAPPSRPFTRPYYLVVGRISRHKGLETLIDAWALTSKERDLVLVLPPNDAVSSQSRAWKRQGVRVVQGLTDLELDSLARHASAIVCPSTEEGYGLPLAEAAGSGRPILASDIPVYREMRLQGVRWVSPGSRCEWTEALAEPPNEHEAARWIGSPPTWQMWRAQLTSMLHVVGS